MDESTNLNETKAEPESDAIADMPDETTIEHTADEGAEQTTADDNHDADLPEEDKELFTEFGEVISEAIVDALKEVYGEEAADKLCAGIAQEARDSEQPIQEIISEKVAEIAGIDLEARVDTPSMDIEPPAEPEIAEHRGL